MVRLIVRTDLPAGGPWWRFTLCTTTPPDGAVAGLDLPIAQLPVLHWRGSHATEESSWIQIDHGWHVRSPSLGHLADRAQQLTADHSPRFGDAHCT